MPNTSTTSESLAAHQLPEVQVSYAETIDPAIIENYYDHSSIQRVLTTTLAHMDNQWQKGVKFPYFAQLEATLWSKKAKELALYITDSEEGRALNLEARDKDYATNILSYPSDLPAFLINELPTLPLGELIICHEVVVRQAEEQGKTVSQHVTHLLVHGILHLLGFDHELGQAEQQQMEEFEIAILAMLGFANPYDPTMK